MSRENVVIVRTMYENFAAIQSRLRTGTLPIEEPIAEDIEWDATDIGLPDLGDGHVRGREGVRRFWMTWLSAWEDTSFVYELRDAGEKVVALIDQTMRASGGLENEVSYAQIWTFRHGEVVHWKLYWDQAEALEAAGLPA